MVYKCAVIGCGRIGCGFDDDPKRKQVATHAKAYFTLSETELIALCDVDKEKLAKYGKKFSTKTYTDYKDMFKKEKLDILSVCTLNNTHLEIVEEAIKNKANLGLKAIFCEKPIADNLKNAQKMIELCKKNKVILSIGHQRRFDPMHRNIRKFILEGKFGELQQASFYYSAGISNTGTHMFDLLRFLFGDVEWVSAFKSEAENVNSADPNLDGTINFKNGGRCTIQAIDVKKFMLFELDAIGTKSRLKILDSGFKTEYYTIEDSPYYDGYFEPYKTKPPFKVDDEKNYLINGVKHIIECIETGKEPLGSGTDGKKALELISAFHLSASQNGKKVFLPLKKDIRLSSK